MTEEQFWVKYFQSKRFHEESVHNRTTISTQKEKPEQEFLDMTDEKNSELKGEKLK